MLGKRPEHKSSACVPIRSVPIEASAEKAVKRNMQQKRTDDGHEYQLAIQRGNNNISIIQSVSIAYTVFRNDRPQ